jgi:hypothetical protein
MPDDENDGLTPRLLSSSPACMHTSLSDAHQGAQIDQSSNAIVGFGKIRLVPQLYEIANRSPLAT